MAILAKNRTGIRPGGKRRTFRRFPKHQKEKEPPKPNLPAANSPMPQTDLLLVDASRTARYPMRLLLQRLGAKVRTADSAEQALELITTAPPDAVLAARILPAMNALELLELMQSNSATAMIPLIIYCADDAWPLRQIALTRGAAAVLTHSRAELELPALLADIRAGKARPASASLDSGVTPGANTSIVGAFWRLPAANDVDAPGASSARGNPGTEDVSRPTSNYDTGRRALAGAACVPAARAATMTRPKYSYAVGAAFSAIALIILGLALMAW